MLQSGKIALIFPILSAAKLWFHPPNDWRKLATIYNAVEKIDRFLIKSERLSYHGREDKYCKLSWILPAPGLARGLGNAIVLVFTVRIIKYWGKQERCWSVVLQFLVPPSSLIGSEQVTWATELVLIG